jgi:hypothetical protein
MSTEVVVHEANHPEAEHWIADLVDRGHDGTPPIHFPAC